MPQIRVRLRIPDQRPEDHGSRVRVSLMDTSQADALHPTVTEATGVVSAGGDDVEVVLDVPEGALDARNRYSLFAHVDHRGDGKINPGDLIITQNVPVTIDQAGAEAGPLRARLTRI